jgi:type I restriction enzyme S subunit
MRVKASTVEDLPLPLPNVAEQRRIVAELEKQFSRLDEAVANLKRVKVNLKRNRAAVLKAAVEGRLVPTEAELARREGRSYESGATLACRILDARRTRWTGRGKYKETTAADVTCLPELPEGWTWVSLDALSWDSGYGTSVKCSYEGQGLAVLRIPNVQNGAIDLSDLKFGPPDFSPPSGELLDVGDMLVIRTNGSKALIGRAAIVNQLPPRPLAFASYLIRFRLCESEGIAKWVNLVWAESRSRKWIEARAATSAGQHNISQSMLATAPIPLPPAKELIRIAVEVDRCLSMLREVEAGVDASLIRAIALRQAVLTRGFS